jgi:hypothetical protein
MGNCQELPIFWLFLVIANLPIADCLLLIAYWLFAIGLVFIKTCQVQLSTLFVQA